MFVNCITPDAVKELARLLKQHGLIPDVLSCQPQQVIDLRYRCRTDVHPGIELTPTLVRHQPIIRWLADPRVYHTLAMIDPDAPSRKHPKYRCWLHWLVGNVPGCDVVRGEQLFGYIGSRPPVATGAHRYLFVVFKQYCQLDFDEDSVSSCSYEGRPSFNIKRFAKKYALGNPIAATFFLASW
ncbi:CG30060, partial [Drosophila busckii]